MKYKVRATHYVDAPSWVEAEKRVEQGLSEADAIESEPVSKAPADIVKFGIASKLYDLHFDIYFNNQDDSERATETENLRAETIRWITNIIDDIMSNNEQEWE